MLICCVLGIARADDQRLTDQRAAFKLALAAAEMADWNDVQPYLELLRDYPLRPDLSAAWLKSNLGPETDAEVARFLEQYPALGFSGDLRYRWSRSLARRGSWKEFLRIYDAYYQKLADSELQCLALTGRLRTGQGPAVIEASLRLWMSPYSQPEECDPLFEFLTESGVLTNEVRRKRMRMALEAGQLQRARYVARPLGDPDRAAIERWAKMRSDPDGQLSDPQGWEATADGGDLVTYGFRRLARLDPRAAEALWPRYRDFGLSAEDALGIQRDIALAYARGFLPGARDLIDDQASRDNDPIVSQWRVRLALRDLDWDGALAALDGLPEEEKARTIWAYWRARATDGSGDTATAETLFATLAGERDYYSFLAADRLGIAYQLGHRPAVTDEEMISALAARPDVIRTRELFMTGLYGRGRTEWQTLLEHLSPAERAQASVLAHRWGWHSQAIITASANGLMDDLDLRFPTPWRDSFESLSRRASLEPSFAYGIARSESLFMSDVASRAGAIGLMQLMPATGKQTARLAGIRYQGNSTLTDPESNIVLGTTYLGRMLERFGGSMVLAAAAYNAGPHRVSAWLPKAQQLPADVWIDTIPFRETRRYVRRVLESDTIFDWRIDGEHRSLSERMPPVSPDGENRGS
jgi:soluble lytic murein transglycosylase